MRRWSASHSTTLSNNLLRQAIGSTYAGASYMDGEIAHACAGGDSIDAKVPEQMAYGMSPANATGNAATASNELLYWIS